MHRLILTVMLIAIVINCFATDPKRAIDSLKNELNHAHEDSTRFRLHFFIAQQFLLEGEYDSQLVHASSALSFAEKISPLNEQQRRFEAGSLRLTGIYYRTQGDYERAIDFYLQALKSFESLKDSNGIASTINSIGIAYLALKRYDEAYDYFRRAHDLDSLLGRKEKVAADLTNMCYALQGNGYRPDSFYTKSLAIGKQALQIATELGNKQLMIPANEAIAISLRDLKRPEEAMVYQKKALDLAEELNLPSLVAEQEYLLAQVYFDLGDYPKSIEYGLKSKKIADQESIYSYYYDIYEGLSNSFAKTGDYEKAFEYSQKLNVVIDSTYKTQITDQLKRFESERKDNQIKLLSSENQLKEKENQTTRAKLERNQIAVIGFAILLAMVSILAWLIYRNRQQKIKNIKTLQELNGQLQKQKEEITRMNTVLELKALRAQMNPHFIFNCMSSIQECMLTGRLDDANLYLTKLSKLLRMVLLYADDESISLEKELNMLRLYLDLEALRLKDGFRYEIKVDDEIFPEEVQVPTLILQPFAENAIWHGLLNKPSDRHLIINIASSGETLDCSVEDNGIGREKAHEMESGSKKHQSKGLELIERRLNILREKTHQFKTGITFTDLKTSISESAGTRVDIILPLLSS